MSFNCLVHGKCKEYEYEYIFSYNGEEIKADNCFSNLYGYSYCVVDGLKYENVSYSYKTKEIDVQRVPVISVFLFFLTFYLTFLICRKFCFYASNEEY